MVRRSFLPVIGGAALLVAGAVAATTSDPPTRTLAVTGRANAYVSADGHGQFAAAAWGAIVRERTGDLYVAVSRDSGRRFAPPVRVSDASTQANLAGEQPPRVAFVPTSAGPPELVVVWTSRGPAGTRLLVSRSADLGATFSVPADVPGSQAAGNRGWHSVAATADGGVQVVWLDHRELAATAGAPSAGAHQHGVHSAGSEDGVARAQLSKLVVATLDGGARELAGGVCYCCKTAVATATDGAVYTAWRHVYPGSIRDIAFARSRDGGATFEAPTRVSEDGWVLNGCPENGPSIAVDARGHVHVLWPTLVQSTTPGSEPQLALFYAVSTDGQHFTPRLRVPTEGVPRHPQIVAQRGGGVMGLWEERAGGVDRVTAARIGPDAGGNMQFTRQIVGEGEYPAAAATSEGVMVAWTARNGAASAVQTRLLTE
jgi:hypothetical protein